MTETQALGDKQMAKQTFWSVLNEGSALVATTVAFLLLGIQLKASGYGAFLGVTAVIGPFSSFATGGTYLTLLDHMKRGGRSGVEVVRSCISLAMSIGVASTILTATIVLLSINGLSWQTVVLLCLGDLVFGSIANALVGAIQIERGFSTAARLRIGYQTARVAMLVALWRTSNLRLLPYAASQTALWILFCIATSTIVHRIFQRTVLTGWGKKEDLKTVVTYSVGLSALSVQNDGDNFTLNKVGFVEDAGRYGFAYRLVQLGLLPVHAFVGVTHVSFLEGSEVMRPIERAYRLARIAAIYVAFVSIVVLVAAPLVPRIVGHQYAGADNIMRWLVPLIFLRGIGTFAMNGLLGLGLNHLRTRILVINAAFTVGLYIWLIPRYSWKGAAIATNMSEVTLFVAGWLTLFIYQRRADRSGVPTIEEPLTESEVALEILEEGRSL